MSPPTGNGQGGPGLYISFSKVFTEAPPSCSAGVASVTRSFQVCKVGNASPATIVYGTEAEPACLLDVDYLAILSRAELIFGSDNHACILEPLPLAPPHPASTRLACPRSRSRPVTASLGRCPVSPLTSSDALSNFPSKTPFHLFLKTHQGLGHTSNSLARPRGPSVPARLQPNTGVP